VWLVAQLAERCAARASGRRGGCDRFGLSGPQLQGGDQQYRQRADPISHRLPVRATIANPDGRLPQMFASFTIRHTSVPTAGKAVGAGTP
jgi:cobalt-zinc-cadmium efflux system membrane fusion protein